MSIFKNSWNKLQKVFSDNSPMSFSYSDYEEITNHTYAVNSAILASYVMNAYRFENLPDDLDQNLMWAMLTQHSKIAVFWHDDYEKFLAFPYTRHTDEKRNFMFKPTLVEALDYNKNRYKVRVSGTPDNEDEFLGSVLYISNTSRFNMDLHLMLDFYARKMTEIDRAIDVRRLYHRAPAMFSGDAKLKQTFQQLFHDIARFKPFFVTSDFMQESFQATNLDFNYINEKLYAEKKQYQNEFLNLWGINNNTAESKKERMIEDEVNANNEQLLINRDNVLNSLNDFCDDFNEKFGTDVVAQFKNAFVEPQYQLADDVENIFDDMSDWGEE